MNTPPRKTKAEALDDEIRRLAALCKLDSWTAYVDPMTVPSDIYPALLSGRPELLKAVQPRALSADESKVLFDIIGNLIETNIALRDHASQLASFTHIWTDAFKQLHSVGERIERFAKFQHGDGGDTEEDGDGNEA
jgi:hypothetical protein